MPITAYRELRNVLVNAPDDAFRDQIISALDELRQMDAGREFLEALNGTAHRVTIGPRQPPDFPSNYCEYDSDMTRFTLLARAVAEGNDVLFRQALTAALGTAQRQTGLSRDYFARQLTQGASPLTYDTAHNIGGAPRRTAIPAEARGSGTAVMAAVDEQVRAARAILDALADGRRTDRPAGWDNDLQRLLRPWLQPGRGTSCTVGFDPTQTYPCDADPARKNRPPLIGLAHELVHAWRALYGRQLYVRGDRFDIEEVIATGFPPYNFERFSENLFRSQYRGPELVMRVTYSWLPSMGGAALPRSG